MLWILGRFIRILRAIAISAQSVVVRPMAYDRPLRGQPFDFEGGGGMGDLVWVKILFCPNRDRIFSLTYNGLLFFQHTP